MPHPDPHVRTYEYIQGLDIILEQKVINKDLFVFHIFYYQEINQCKKHTCCYTLQIPSHTFTVPTYSFLVLQCSFSIHCPSLINVKNLWEGDVHSQCDALRKGFGELKLQTAVSSSFGTE